MFTFKTVLLGLDVEVGGEFSPAEPQTLTDPGWPPGFEIESITHKGEDIEIDQVPDEWIKDIEEEAFKAASDQNEGEQ